MIPEAPRGWSAVMQSMIRVDRSIEEAKLRLSPARHEELDSLREAVMEGMLENYRRYRLGREI